MMENTVIDERASFVTLRVLQLIPTLGGGGAERQLSLLAGPLIDHGVELHIGFQHGGPNGRVLEQSGAHLHKIPISSYNDPRLLTAMISLIRAVQPDVVHTWLMSMDTLGGMAARWCGVPWLMSERTSPEAYRHPRVKDHLRRYLARFATGIVGNSINGLDFWRDVIPADRRFLLHNAIPVDQIDKTTPVVRTALPVAVEPPLVVYAGRFVRDKNVNVLLDAFIELASLDEAVALFCGEGPERAGLETRIRESGLSDKISVSGYRDDLWSVLRAADCVVSLSRYEGSANVVLEAMACGCPLVLSDIPAHRVDAGDAAWYVDRESAAAVAATIRRVLTSEAEARMKVVQGRERAVSHTPARCAQELGTVYRAATQARTLDAA